MKYPPRWSVCLLVLLLAVAGVTLLSGERASANHPVLVEGNCESPVPGTTIVSPGTCGDYDGDGRIGTAEDTDGADRIFGTLTAAVGPGTGAAAGTGANMNGRVIIVRSGRFAEQLVLASTPTTPTLGNLQIEGAPGVEVNIDAVFQGDPAGANATRQNGIGIYVDFLGDRTVTLRNLTVRNFSTGLIAATMSRVHVDNCRFENNLNYGLRIFNQSRLTMNGSRVTSTGFRLGAGMGVALTPDPGAGAGVQFENNSGGVVSNTLLGNNSGAGLRNNSANPSVRTFHLVLADNDGGGTVGNPVIKEDY